MNKYILLISILLCSSISLFSQNEYHIDAKVGNYNPPTTAYLLQQEGNQFRIDSCLVYNGKFAFTGTADYPFFAHIVLNYEGTSGLNNQHGSEMISLYTDPARIEIRSDKLLSKATITGSPTTDLFYKYQESLIPFKEEGQKLQAVYEQAQKSQRLDQTLMDSLNSWNQSIQERYNKASLEFIVAHPNSYIGISMLQSEINTHPGNPAVAIAFDQLSDQVRNSSPGQELARLIEQNAPLRIASTAPDFSVISTENNLVELAHYKGKHLLLYFWSPDCEYCKQATIAIKEAYKQYKDKGLEVLGIAVEHADNKAQWLEAIELEGVEWTNVSDLNGWQSNIVKQYHVHATPFTYLLNSEAKILAVEIYGDKLLQTLGDILK